MTSLVDKIAKEAEITVRALAENLHWTEEGYDPDLCGYIARLYDLTEWGWCIAEVRVTWKGLESQVYLGGSSYKSEEDFRSCSYFADMVTEAIESIATQARTIAQALEDERDRK